MGDWPNHLLDSSQPQGHASAGNMVKRWQVNQSPHEQVLCFQWCTQTEYVMYDNVIFSVTEKNWLLMPLQFFFTSSFVGENKLYVHSFYNT